MRTLNLRFCRAATAALCGVLLWLGSAPGAAAQSSWEVSTSVGLFAPATDVIAGRLVLDEDPDSPPLEFQSSYRETIAVGARVAHWLSKRIALEVSALYTPSHLELEDAAGQPSLDAEVLWTGLRGRLRVGPTDGTTALHLLGGAGSVVRSGDTFEALDGTTDLAWIAGAGLDVRLSRSVTLRLDVEDYMSSADFRRPGPDGGEFTGGGGVQFTEILDTKFQHELVFSQAIVISIGG